MNFNHQILKPFVIVPTQRDVIHQRNHPRSRPQIIRNIIKRMTGEFIFENNLNVEIHIIRFGLHFEKPS